MFGKIFTMIRGLFFILFLISGTLFAQQDFEVFREKEKSGVKNSKREIIIKPEYLDIFMYGYFSDGDDTSATGKIFIAVKSGIIEEQIHLDSTDYLYYDEISGTTLNVKRKKYKTVKNGKLDIYGKNGKLMIENAEDFAYLTVAEDDQNHLPGFSFYNISSVFSLGNYNFSFEINSNNSDNTN